MYIKARNGSDLVYKKITEQEVEAAGDSVQKN